MKCLSFSRSSVSIDGRRVRTLTFEERSLLPTSAACVVANGVRETFATLLGTVVTLRLFEPTIPSPEGWSVIARDAMLYRLRGPQADAAIVLRPRDAVALATTAFGEPCAQMRPLSLIERAVLDRAIAAIAGTFAPVCGIRGEVPAPEPAHDLSGFVTYFELQLERPVQLRLGVALSRDPQPEPLGRLTIDDLLDIELELSVRIEGRSIPAYTIAELENGEIVPITQAMTLPGMLYLAGAPVARGECGVQGERYAIAIDAPNTSERSHEAAS